MKTDPRTNSTFLQCQAWYENETGKYKRCDQRVNWYECNRRLGLDSDDELHLPHIKPEAFCQIAWQWSKRVPPGKCENEVNKRISGNTIQAYYKFFRQTVTDFLEDTTAGEQIGGPGRIVAIDETFFTKRHQGHPFLKRTRPNKQIVLGGVELDGPWAGRKTTGRAFLVCIPDRGEESIKAAIRQFVHQHSVVWTDGYSGYEWMERTGEYKHESIVHRLK